MPIVYTKCAPNSLSYTYSICVIYTHIQRHNCMYASVANYNFFYSIFQYNIFFPTLFPNLPYKHTHTFPLFSAHKVCTNVHTSIHTNMLFISRISQAFVQINLPSFAVSFFIFKLFASFFCPKLTCRTMAATNSQAPTSKHQVAES